MRDRERERECVCVCVCACVCVCVCVVVVVVMMVIIGAAIRFTLAGTLLLVVIVLIHFRGFSYLLDFREQFNRLDLRHLAGPPVVPVVSFSCIRLRLA